MVSDQRSGVVGVFRSAQGQGEVNDRRWGDQGDLEGFREVSREALEEGSGLSASVLLYAYTAFSWSRQMLVPWPSIYCGEVRVMDDVRGTED